MDPELDTELEGLKELLNLLIDEIIKKVERIGKHMILISSVEEVLEREIETKTIIQIKKVNFSFLKNLKH